MRLGLFFGGRSSEYEISLRSLMHVYKCLSELEDIDIVLIGVSREGKFYLYEGPLEAIADDTWLEEDIAPIYWRMDPEEPGFFTESFTGLKFHPLDIAFPCLHGEYGEDGTIQGLFEMMHLPYVGSGVLGSAIALDKAVSRQVFDRVGIPQAKWLWLRESRYHGAPEEERKKILGALELPLFVKPANTGSSVGITKVKNEAELADALELAFQYDGKAVIEETIVGRELEVAVLELGDAERRLVVSPAGEVISAHEFYDYEAKYADVGSRLIIPAKIDPKTYDQIMEDAKLAFRSAHCAGLVRADFFLGEDGTVYLNELNTMPGFTAISMYPKLMALAGYPGAELMRALLDNALAVHEFK